MCPALTGHKGDLSPCRTGDIFGNMVIGIPRERTVHEYRVAATPRTVRVMAQAGHKVLVEKGAGLGSSVPDELFEKKGAEIVDTEQELFSRAELIVKVKEPQSEEYGLLGEGQTLFSYLHLAPNEELQKALINSGVRAVAFETVELEDGSLPLLVPMSRIAGQLAVQRGIHYLERVSGGKGVLLSGAPGVKPGRVAIIGGGTVGYNAAVVALGLRADVVVIDININKLVSYHGLFKGAVKTQPSYPEIVEREVSAADLVVGAVLVTGARAPRVITKAMISAMEPGSVFVDVAIDQGGCSETSRTTTHEEPVYSVGGVIHYCVANIPSLVSRTASYVLSDTILPYVLKIADGKTDEDPALTRGINVDRGKTVLDMG